MGGFGGMGMGGYGMGGYGVGGFGYPGAYGGAYNAPMTTSTANIPANQTPSSIASGTAGSTTPANPDLTGAYLGAGTPGGPQGRIPRVIPNPFDNTLLVQGTPQEWEQISGIIEQLDVPPRQVLIDAKIYEVNLTGQFSAGVQAYLQKVGASSGSNNSNGSGQSSGPALSRQLEGTSTGTLTLTAGLLVGHSRELLGLLTASEQTTRAKVVSAPSVIATDSVAASINVGQTVPTLAAQAVIPGVQQGGSNVFTNTVSNVNTGVTLNILARVNSSGIVTLMINQDYSIPVPPSPGAAIQSPSFTRRNVQTQLTVRDGDTVALGGIIQESDTSASGGIPFLHRLPVVGTAFGNKNSTKLRTELIVFLTPRVIYDSSQLSDASEELKSKLKRLRKILREQE